VIRQEIENQHDDIPVLSTNLKFANYHHENYLSVLLKI
jgi:hypothetical protein